MAFYEHRLPLDISKMASGGIGFRTLVNEGDSGYETRIRKFSRPRGRWDLSGRLMRIRENVPALRSDIETIQALHVVQEGKAHGFRFQHNLGPGHLIGDPDNPTTTNEQIGSGDASTTQFQAYKNFTYGAVTYSRPVLKLVASTYTVLLNGTPQTEGGGNDYTIDITTGVITFNSPPGGGVAVQLAAEYDIPVRFDVDLLEIDEELAALGEIPSIPIVELKIPLEVLA